MPFEVQHQVDLPTGQFLRATLAELEIKEIPKRDPKPGESATFQKLKWIFEITEQGDYFGRKVQAETSAYLSDSQYNQFRNWSEALLGRELPSGTLLDEQDLIGLSSLISVKYEEDRRDSSKKWARVEEVIPLDPVSFGDAPPF